MVYTSSLSLYKQIRDEIKLVYGHESDMIAMFIVEDVTSRDIYDAHMPDKLKSKTDPSQFQICADIIFDIVAAIDD